MESTNVLDGRRLAVVVIGAGQAGLSAAYYLAARGLRPWTDFVVLDANDGPGGAWRHRWDSLTLGRVHGIHKLPGMDLEGPDRDAPANRTVPRYYGDYESRFGLPILRPVTVTGVAADGDGFAVTTDDGPVAAASVVNATGTWDSPYRPHYPGAERFAGRQLHTREYRDAEQFRGQRVLVVGAGTSALQFIQELDARGADTVWAARRTPQWTSRAFDRDWGLNVERAVSARTREGLAPLSVSAVTGIPLTDLYVPDIRRGLLAWRGRIERFGAHTVILDGPGPDGVSLPGQGEAQKIIDRSMVRALPGRAVGSTASQADRRWEVPIDAVLWATGFRAHLRHLSPLQIREPGGGILMADDGVSAVRMPGLFLAGYGASASTLGATRAGRKAAMGALRSVPESAPAG
ncbi:FAD-dependent oxidoreductase [Spelaeicoccus albus]|uniref:Cation diffusion facilitator CzcD-associated flavoprotein CzcO n=1 Tax=Spelaeicoccus albus TaxID=1280376 RepID=A0A7Z0IHJ6_9MICO|nr:cation diffusion facilitator CzcD-associated flavoprotein CzcO [Spelaeicoccus albus]